MDAVEEIQRKWIPLLAMFARVHRFLLKIGVVTLRNIKVSWAMDCFYFKRVVVTSQKSYYVAVSANQKLLCFCFSPFQMVPSLVDASKTFQCSKDRNAKIKQTQLAVSALTIFVTTTTGPHQVHPVGPFKPYPSSHFFLCYFLLELLVDETKFY